MNRNQNILAVPSECFVYGVVDNFKNHVVQTSAVIGITDIHAWAFTNCIKPFQDLNTGRIVIIFCHNKLLYFSLTVPCSTWNIFVSWLLKKDNTRSPSIADTKTCDWDATSASQNFD